MCVSLTKECQYSRIKIKLQREIKLYHNSWNLQFSISEIYGINRQKINKDLNKIIKQST